MLIRPPRSGAPAANGVCREAPTFYKVYASLVIGRCLLLFSICVVPLIAVADVAGNVVSVADGDTVTILDGFNRQYKVRLAGIDAPEKGQPFGQRSKQTLSECAFGRWASVEGDKVDRYGRLVGKVHVSGVDCNLRQVEQGLAWHYKQYLREQQAADRIEYDKAETAARKGRLGLWHETTPIPPWDFRRRQN